MACCADEGPGDGDRCERGADAAEVEGGVAGFLGIGGITFSSIEGRLASNLALFAACRAECRLLSIVDVAKPPSTLLISLAIL